MVGPQMFTRSPKQPPLPMDLAYTIVEAAGRATDHTGKPEKGIEDFNHGDEISCPKSDQKYLVSSSPRPFCITSERKDKSESSLRNFKCTLNSRLRRRNSAYQNLCIISVLAAFGFGILLGVLLPLVSEGELLNIRNITSVINSTEDFRIFKSVVDKYSRIDSKDTKPKQLSVTRKPVHFPKAMTDDKSEERDGGNLRRTLDKPDIFSTVTFVNEKGLKLLEDSHGRNYSEDDDSFTAESIANMKRILNVDNFELKRNNKDVRKEQSKERALDDNTIVYDDIFWGPKIEKFLPQGYGPESSEVWSKYMKHGVAAKMEFGCGRMQNRLVTFEDGSQACVRYRQNTDQIQGELFSFYLANLLNLTNLAPSAVSVVNVENELWKNLGDDIAAAQWNTNRPVIMTKYIPNLDQAHIPAVFKPSDRHLNKFDVYSFIKNEFKSGPYTKSKLLKKIASSALVKKDVRETFRFSDFSEIVEKITESTRDKLVELAQWSDLIIFDYLTANLDRVVNNLYNFQWNVNIMDAPAHNLAKKIDNNLLLFLDNESGMLHGYRLLKKYEVYHNMLLENLCIFRKSTVDAIVFHHENGNNIGNILNDMLLKGNSADILDVLPPLPDKNVKILQERLSKVVDQVRKCEVLFSNS